MSAPPRFAADFAAIEAGLRGTTAPHADIRQEPFVQGYASPDAQPHAHDHALAEHGYAVDPQFSPSLDAGWGEPAPARAGRGTKRPVYAMAASIAVAVIGIGVAFAYKGSGSSPHEIKTIMAAAGPIKVQPPAEQASDQGDQDVNALGQQPAPTKLVSREEQPVDLSQAVQDNSARDAANHGTDAASVPVPLSPAQAVGTMSPDYAALGVGAPPAAASDQAPSAASGEQGFGVGMPAPKRVKSMSVRPDGTIVSADAALPPADTATVQAPAKPSDQIGAIVNASPTADAKAHKTSARVTTMRSVASRPADDGADTATPAAKPSKKAKPVRVASAEVGDQTSPTDVADEAKPAGSGGFAVQLAAPGSEADARSATSRFVKKFGSALHGRRLGYHRAESNGHTVYRVRVSSLTREEATSLCGKLKADGGTCFVAKD